MYESTYYCNLNDYSQEFHYYPFVVKIDRCVWSFNTLKQKTCVIYVKKIMFRILLHVVVKVENI